MKIDSPKVKVTGNQTGEKLITRSPAKYLGFPVFLYFWECLWNLTADVEAARSATRQKGEGGGLAETNFFASSRLLVGHSYPLFSTFQEKNTPLGFRSNQGKVSN